MLVVLKLASAKRCMRLRCSAGRKGVGALVKFLLGLLQPTCVERKMYIHIYICKCVCASMAYANVDFWLGIEPACAWNAQGQLVSQWETQRERERERPLVLAVRLLSLFLSRLMISERRKTQSQSVSRSIDRPSEL